MLNKKQLLEQLLQMKHPQKLLEKLVVIRALLLKYGKKLTLPRFLEGIKNGDADTASMISSNKQSYFTYQSYPHLFVSFRKSYLESISSFVWNRMMRILLLL